MRGDCVSASHGQVLTSLKKKGEESESASLGRNGMSHRLLKTRDSLMEWIPNTQTALLSLSPEYTALIDHYLPSALSAKHSSSTLSFMLCALLQYIACMGD